jgi:alkaline phosphatase D
MSNIVPEMSQLSRRSFLSGVAGAAAVASFGVRADGLLSARGGLPPGLFTLGVASGDPLPDGVVLWTRLAPEPLAGGGMPRRHVPVEWQVATDDSFRHVVRRGRAFASPSFAHSVHVDVRGLRPDCSYAYRFRAGGELSPVGRTRTAPPRARGDRLRFVFASCQNWKDGYWSAWGHAASLEPDLVVHLGDYIYESGRTAGAVRDHNSDEIVTLTDYRNRYGLYKGDPALRAAHAAAPWVVTRDDHEVENNYAGLVPQDPVDAPTFAARRAAAYQAWWEHQPVRIAAPSGPDLSLQRSLAWGTLARFHLLDTRQFRSDQPCGDEDLGPTCPERTAPDRTMLGARQEKRLGKRLLRSPATWDILANQVVMTSMPLAGTIFNRDQWDGYPAARSRLLGQLRDASTENAVVITGDIHAAGVATLVGEEPDGSPSTETFGTELVGTSVSSSFPPDLVDVAEDLIAALPHVEWVDARHRGITVCDLFRDRLEARYEQVQAPLDPNSPVVTGTSWTIEAGQHGVHPT